MHTCSLSFIVRHGLSAEASVQMRLCLFLVLLLDITQSPTKNVNALGLPFQRVMRLVSKVRLNWLSSWFWQLTKYKNLQGSAYGIAINASSKKREFLEDI